MTLLTRILDAFAREDEPVSQREFRMFAAVGIALAVTVLCLEVYVRYVEAGERARTPATWQRSIQMPPGL